jgi:hypothetical protein
MPTALSVFLSMTLLVNDSVSLLSFRKVMDLRTKNPILLQPHQLYSSSFAAGLPLPDAKEQPQNMLFYSFS